MFKVKTKIENVKAKIRDNKKDIKDSAVIATAVLGSSFVCYLAGRYDGKQEHAPTHGALFKHTENPEHYTFVTNSAKRRIRVFNVTNPDDINTI